MKPWLIVVLTVEAVLILLVLALLVYLCGSSPAFKENAASTFKAGVRGIVTPLNVVLYVIAACVLIPAQLAYLSWRKRSRYDD